MSLFSEQTRLYQVIKYRFLERVRSESNDPSRLGMEIYRLFCGLHAVSCGLVPAGFSGGRRVENRRVSLLIELLRNIKTSHMIVWTNHRESIFALNEGLTESLPWLRSHMLFGGRPRGYERSVLISGERQGSASGNAGNGRARSDAYRGGSCLLFFGKTGNISLRIQAEDRSHRIGQKRKVHYVTIQCDCNIDNRIHSALMRKANALEELKREIGKLGGDYTSLRNFVERRV